MKYKILENFKFDNTKYFFRGLRFNDMNKIRKWRNKQIIYLRQSKKIMLLEQYKYYFTKIKNEKNNLTPNQILFGIEFSGKLIGYGGLTNVDWLNKKAEISFLLDNKIKNKSKDYQKHFLMFLNYTMVVSKFLGFSELFTETYELRDKHIKVLENFGFQLQKTFPDFLVLNGKKIRSLIHTFKII